MKSLKLFLIVVFTLFVVDKIVYFGLYSVEKNVFSGDGIGKINHFFLVKDTTNTIIFGNSRANHHINPSFFGNSSFNIGVGGRKMAFSASLIQTLPKAKPQNVFLQIDPHYVFDTTYVGNDIDALIVKYHQNDVIKEKIDEIGMNNKFSLFFWCLDYNGVVFSIFSNKFNPKNDIKKYRGYDPIENSSEQKAIFIKRLKKIQNTIDCPTQYKPSSLELMYLKQIKEFCKNNNKKLILFTSPVYKDQCKLDNQAMLKLMKKNKIDYRDYTDYFQNDDNLDYWKDENHLSRIGAEKFSKYLAQELISITN